MNRSVREDIKGIRVVKSFVREDFEKKKFEAASEDVCKDFTLAERIMAVNTPTMQFCIWLAFLLIFLLAAIITGQAVEANKVELAVTGPDLTALIMYASQILSAVMQLSMVLVMIIIARTSAERIVAVLNEKSSITSPENAVSEVKDGDIVFDNVSFKYSKDAERFALEGVNLHIKSGQTIGILGGTGSSKSTLVNLIPRLYDVTEGAVVRRRGQRQGLRPRRAAQQGRDGLAEERALLGHHQGKPALGQGGRDGRRDAARVQARLRGRLHPVLPRQVRHLHRAGRHQRLGRAEAAPVHRARPPQRPEGAHPRRLDVRRRHQDGRHDPPLLPRTDPQRDQDHHRPARLVGCRTPTRSSSWTAAASMPSARTRSCSLPTRSIGKCTTRRTRSAMPARRMPPKEVPPMRKVNKCRGAAAENAQLPPSRQAAFLSFPLL